MSLLLKLVKIVLRYHFESVSAQIVWQYAFDCKIRVENDVVVTFCVKNLTLARVFEQTKQYISTFFSVLLTFIMLLFRRVIIVSKLFIFILTNTNELTSSHFEAVESLHPGLHKTDTPIVPLDAVRLLLAICVWPRAGNSLTGDTGFSNLQICRTNFREKMYHEINIILSSHKSF